MAGAHIDEHMHMVWHDHPSEKFISNAFKMQPVLDDERGDFRSAQKAAPATRVEKRLELFSLLSFLWLRLQTAAYDIRR